MHFLAWACTAYASFIVAYQFAWGAPLAVVYLFALVQIAQAETWRKAFYTGLVVGLAIAASRLTFFWTIFSAGAVALWLVFAVWIGLFTAFTRLCLRRWPAAGWLAIPIVWTGLEYFRSELYYLRFSWLSPGYAFADRPFLVPLHWLGVYGAGFVLASAASVSACLWRRSRFIGVAVGLLISAAVILWGLAARPGQTTAAQVLRVAGLQLEFPTEKEVLLRLTEVVKQHPEAELIVLPEYTFAEEIPERVRQWCRSNRKYLIAGGKAPAPGAQFYNTAFVIGPTGETLFTQAKRVPIQFFKDGSPAPSQRIWESPWGKLGICICYDLSYTRITDALVRKGAQALIVPTMDVADWGLNQHALHARIAPVRAREYGLPIFRVASSGISQSVESDGRLSASAPFGGDGKTLYSQFVLPANGRLPLDRWVAPTCVALTIGLVSLFAWTSLLLCVKGFLQRSDTAAHPTGSNSARQSSNV